MHKEFELRPHADPVVLYVMNSRVGKMVGIQLKTQFFFINLVKIIQLCRIGEINHKQEGSQKRCCAWVRKVTKCAEDQGKKIKEKEFEMEDIKTFQEKII